MGLLVRQFGLIELVGGRIGKIEDGLLGKPCCCLANVELSSHDIRDETRAIFAEKLDLSGETSDGCFDRREFALETITYGKLLVERRGDWYRNIGYESEIDTWLRRESYRLPQVLL